MNILEGMKMINATAKYLFVTLVVLSMVPAVFASPTGITSALQQLCLMSQQFLGLVAMVLIVLAGSIYAIGQILGAETRARAAVWATSMLIGAVIGIIIYLVTPYLISVLLSGSPGISVSPTNPCGV
ncbi:MAG: hypothetical protein AB1295_05780 [Candidatus Micrarchaeota archaeon]